MEIARSGDVEAAITNARANVELIQDLVEDKLVVLHRDDMVVKEFDLEKLGPRPRRGAGFLRVSSAEGFIAAVNQRRATDPDNEPVLYADEASLSLVCVLNDSGPEGPGWRDHVISLEITKTEEWEHWTRNQGLGTQERFARTVQEGQAEIVRPEPGSMMDIAQSFHMTSSAKAKQAKRLRDGRTQFVYEEDVEAVAGEDGTVEIPEVFTIRLRPFYGSAAFEVDARLEFTPPRGGQLQIGYHLHRPRDVERAAYSKVVEDVAAALEEMVVIEGQF